MHTREQLRRDLAALGIRPGDTVLMHSSFRSLGGIEDGAKGFFETFLELLAAEGTLVLPTLSYASVTAEQPCFDVGMTPSCVGWLPEYFRAQVPGVRRSLHATHSCAAVGRNAELLLAGHELDTTPVGPHSPFAKLPKVGGKILFLGCHPDHNTSMHGVEETVPEKRFIDFTRAIAYRLTDAEGRMSVVPSYRHHFERTNGVYEQRYSRIIGLLEGDECARGKVLDADCVVMDAAAVWKKGHEKMLEKPYFFVEWQERRKDTEDSPQ